MSPLETYDWLTNEKDVSFDTHVCASILALSTCEAMAQNKPIFELAGYEGSPSILMGMFPQAQTLLEGGGPLRRQEDESCLLDLLYRGMSCGNDMECLIAGMIARRAQCPNHLWQDLGLRNRGELSTLMVEHFAPLARRNRSDMKWKKFFFRTICRDADYTLCTAPSCDECCDFNACFNEETGESLLAHLRRTS